VRIHSALLIALVLLLACAHFPVNAPIDHTDPKYGYRVSATSGDTDDSQQLLLIVNFSGGGTLAAAFAYGVLKGLADTKVRFDGRERALVDEIDILSSVSGGSFTAAYFSLYGARIFEDFESRFLQ
jgi:NTE family protein